MVPHRRASHCASRTSGISPRILEEPASVRRRRTQHPAQGSYVALSPHALRETCHVEPGRFRSVASRNFFRNANLQPTEQHKTLASDTFIRDFRNDYAVRNHAHHAHGNAVAKEQSIPASVAPLRFPRQGVSTDALELNRNRYLAAFVSWLVSAYVRATEHPGRASRTRSPALCTSRSREIRFPLAEPGECRRGHGRLHPHGHYSGIDSPSCPVSMGDVSSFPDRASCGTRVSLSPCDMTETGHRHDPNGAFQSLRGWQQRHGARGRTAGGATGPGPLEGSSPRSFHSPSATVANGRLCSMEGSRPVCRCHPSASPWFTLGMAARMERMTESWNWCTNTRIQRRRWSTLPTLSRTRLEALGTRVMGSAALLEQIATVPGAMEPTATGHPPSPRRRHRRK